MGIAHCCRSTSCSTASRPSCPGGQRQRVAIGRALVQQAKVFLFDEPLSNLDAKLRTEMRVELKRLHRELGATIIYVTHDQIEAMTLATRIAVMRAGRIEQYAAPDDLYEAPATLFVAGFVGSPAMNFMPGRLVSGAVEIGATQVPLNGYRFRSTAALGQNVILGIRPEHVDTRRAKITNSRRSTRTPCSWSRWAPIRWAGSSAASIASRHGCRHRSRAGSAAACD